MKTIIKKFAVGFLTGLIVMALGVIIFYFIMFRI